MKLDVQPNAEAVAERASEWLAAAAHSAVAARGSFALAVSGGRTPWQMLRLFAARDMPWSAVHVFQVDERVAPASDAERNLTHLRESLSRAPLPAGQLHAMPVESPDLAAAAARYAAALEQVAGSPPVLDLVHLGLGSDGHTASLLVGDPVLDITDRAVAVTGAYRGYRRLTLTYPTLDRAREILWLVTGGEKASALARLCDGDTSVPAGRVRPERARILADAAAAGRLRRS
jgi:6-phosphogluconolactonase